MVSPRRYRASDWSIVDAQLYVDSRTRLAMNREGITPPGRLTGGFRSAEGNYAVTLGEPNRNSCCLHLFSEWARRDSNSSTLNGKLSQFARSKAPPTPVRTAKFSGALTPNAMRHCHPERQ